MAYHWSRTGDFGRAEFDCVNCKTHGHHKRRNCRKFFPQDFDANRKDIAWIAEYQDRKKLRRQVRETRTSECPRSLISEQSAFLLGQYVDAERAFKAMGASMFGNDSGKWPAWWADAVSVIRGAEGQATAIECGE